MRHIPLIHQGRLGLPHALAQAPHPRPGVIGLPTRVGQPVRPVPRQVRVAHQHHLRAVGQLRVDLLQDGPGLRSHARHGRTALDGLALHTTIRILDDLPATRGASESEREAAFDDIPEAHVIAADRQHHQIGVNGHLADLPVHDVTRRTATVGKIRQGRVRTARIEPVHVVVRPIIAAAVRLSPRIARILPLIVTGTIARRIGITEQSDVQRHVLLILHAIVHAILRGILYSRLDRRRD